MNNKLISIIVPMYFEEAVAEECYNRLTSVAASNNLNYELIFVNDGSKDSTPLILDKLSRRDSHVKVINFSRNFGHQIAVTAGLDKSSGDAVVIIDADLQDPPELIPEMIRLWEMGYDVVYGKRKKRDGESFVKLATAKAFYRVLNKLSCIDIPMDTGDFRLIDKKVVGALKKMPEQNRFLRGMCSWVGFKQISLEYERKERYAGETKYPFKKMLKFAADGIFSFSAKPIKLIESLGLMIIFFSGAIFLYALLKELKSPGSFPLGWTLAATFIVSLCGMQLLSIGIIGEYITRIYDEAKARPLYVIEKELNMAKCNGKHLFVIGKEIVSSKNYTDDNNSQGIS